MSPSALLIAFLILLAIQTAVSLTLDLLNAAYVKRHSITVPKVFADIIDGETYAKAVRYTLDKCHLSIFGTLFSAAVLAAIVLSGTFGILDRAISELHRGSYQHGILFIFAVSALISVVDLPLKIYGIFVIEERYGFNKMTFAQWCLDGLKGALLSAVLLTPVLLGLFWFMDRAGSLWWIYGFLFLSSFQILISFLYPVLIAPLFNKFTPLDEGELKGKIFSMAEKVGFKTSGIFLMDGSKRSAHANAYFSGFGHSKRIVLFDTLIQILSTEQAVAVLAHEMGHAKLHHVKRMLVFSLLFSFAGFWILNLMLNWTPLFLAFGFSGPSYHGALVILAFGMGPITFFLAPLFSLLSRRYEYQADRFATDAVGTPKPLGDALLALSKKSLSNLTPHPWYSFFHYSHPTLFERLQALSKLSGPANAAIASSTSAN